MGVTSAVDKDSIDDAGFVKIDFLALGALSQLQEAVELIKKAPAKGSICRASISRIKRSTICCAKEIPSAFSR